MKRRFNFYFGASISSWVLTALIIAAEFSGAFKTTLASIFSHHWIGKLVITALTFFVLGYVFRRSEKYSTDKTAWYSIIGSLTTIFVFYVVMFLI